MRFYHPVSMAREPLCVARMGWSVAWPLPATELVPAIVSKRLMDLRLCVHNKGTILRDRFIDRSTLQKKQFSRLRPIFQCDGNRGV